MINKRRLLINSAKSLAALPLLSNSAVAGSWLSHKRRSPHRELDGGWLAGGTKSMRARFPPTNVPFNVDSCDLLTEETGVGPCYFDNVTTADDISEGQPGVPMALAFKFVKEDCEPIEEGALVEVWWCNYKGVYSADTSDSTNGSTDELFTGEDDIETGGVPPFYDQTCAQLVGGENGEALDTKWFRGKKLTDADGCAYFKGCFPGWYTGRAVHIHLRLQRLGGESLVVQLGYDAEVARAIYQEHPDYTGIDQDTTNDIDPWFSSLASEEGYTIKTLRQRDGSMLAYKTLKCG